MLIGKHVKHLKFMLVEVEDQIAEQLDLDCATADMETLGRVNVILDAIDMAWDDDAPMLTFIITKVRLMAAMSAINEINLDLYLTIPVELQQEYDSVRSEVLEAFNDVEEKLLTFNN
jgi:hypothetical protein